VLVKHSKGRSKEKFVPIREEENQRKRANKGIHGILQEMDIVRFKKSL
jgi:hypothetical protein